MTRRYWADPELAILRQHYPHRRTAELCALLPGRDDKSIYHKAHSLGLKKTAAHLASVQAGRIQRGRLDARLVATQFKPGHVPLNKGKPFDVARTDPRCTAHHFKPGSRPHTWQPVGSYRLNKDGHLQQKVSDAPGNASRRWRGVAEIVWCQANGPLPRGHMVVFKAGRFSNQMEQITLDAVECITLAENMRRNSRHNLPPEVNQLVAIKGAITRQVNRITREHREQTTQENPAP